MDHRFTITYNEVECWDVLVGGVSDPHEAGVLGIGNIREGMESLAAWWQEKFLHTPGFRVFPLSSGYGSYAETRFVLDKFESPWSYIDHNPIEEIPPLPPLPPRVLH